MILTPELKDRHMKQLYLKKDIACLIEPMTKSKPCLQACSSGGCTSTPPLSILMASAPPQNQPPPRVNATGPDTLHAAWDPPSQPNGRTPNIHMHTAHPAQHVELQKNMHKHKLYTHTSMQL